MLDSDRETKSVSTRKHNHVLTTYAIQLSARMIITPLGAAHAIIQVWLLMRHSSLVEWLLARDFTCRVTIQAHALETLHYMCMHTPTGSV